MLIIAYSYKAVNPPVKFIILHNKHDKKERPPKEGVLSVRRQILVSDVGQQSHVTSTLDGGVDLSLVESASTGHAAGQDLTALAEELAELVGILVINVGNLVCAEDADLFSLAAHEGAGRTSSGILSHFLILQ